MAEIFQYLVVFLLAVWTARLAITKGRNGWTWGGAALILGLLPWHLIGVIPVLALMFVKSPAKYDNTPVNPLNCVRCNKSHIEGQHFCTGCGWDLSQTSTAQKSEDDQIPLEQPLIIPNAIDSNLIGEVRETVEFPSLDAELLPEDKPVTADATPAEPDHVAISEEPQQEHIPWGTYDVGEAPTAADMVSRGIERFTEGKVQEAIDQFTKAIALDPKYAEAWKRRSEAYAQLGRSQQAEEDRRHLQTLDPSSSPG